MLLMKRLDRAVCEKGSANMIAIPPHPGACAGAPPIGSYSHEDFVIHDHQAQAHIQAAAAI
jgi:hypothetical protein